MSGPETIAEVTERSMGSDVSSRRPAKPNRATAASTVRSSANNSARAQVPAAAAQANDGVDDSADDSGDGGGGDRRRRRRGGAADESTDADRDAADGDGDAAADADGHDDTHDDGELADDLSPLNGSRAAGAAARVASDGMLSVAATNQTAIVHSANSNSLSISSGYDSMPSALAGGAGAGGGDAARSFPSLAITGRPDLVAAATSAAAASTADKNIGSGWSEEHKAILSKYVAHGGIVSYHKSQTAVAQRLQALQTLRSIKEMRAQHSELRRQQQQSRDSLVSFQSEHARLTGEHASVERELVELEDRIPLPLQRRAEEARLNKTLAATAKRRANAEQQLRVTESEYDRIQGEADALQMKLHKLEPTETALLNRQKAEEHELSVITEYQRQTAIRKATKLNDTKTAASVNGSGSGSAFRSNAATKTAAVSFLPKAGKSTGVDRSGSAPSGVRRGGPAADNSGGGNATGGLDATTKAALARAKARERLTTFISEAQATEATVNDFLSADFNRRAEAVLSVKKNTEAAAAALVAANHVRRQARIAKEAKREHLRQQLTDAGRNAEAVFQARDEAERMRRRAVKLKAARDQNELEVLGRLLKEDDARRRKHELALVEKEKKAQHRRKTGASVVHNSARHVNADRLIGLKKQTTNERTDAMQARLKRIGMSGAVPGGDDGGDGDGGDDDSGSDSAGGGASGGGAGGVDASGSASDLGSDLDDSPARSSVPASGGLRMEHLGLPAAVAPKRKTGSRAVRSLALPGGTGEVGTGGGGGGGGGGNAMTSAPVPPKSKSKSSAAPPLDDELGAVDGIDIGRIPLASDDDSDDDGAGGAGEAAAGAAGGDGDTDAAGSEKKRPLPIMRDEHGIKNAKQKLAAALELQKANLRTGEIKTVCGKQYATSKFLARPDKITFADFVVGQTYTASVVLTNVSFTFNSYRLLPLPDEITDFFEIKYKPAGRMSAAVSSTLTIIFRPKLNEDITAEIPFMAETGPFAVPLECTIKKAHMSVAPRVTDCGTVVRGERAAKELTVSNAGATPVGFTITPLSFVVQPNAPSASAKSNSALLATATFRTGSGSAPPPGVGTAEEVKTAAAGAAAGDAAQPLSSSIEEQIREQLTFPTTGYVAGYSHTPIPIAFHPIRTGRFELRLRIECHEPTAQQITAAAVQAAADATKQAKRAAAAEKSAAAAAAAAAAADWSNKTGSSDNASANSGSLLPPLLSPKGRAAAATAAASAAIAHIDDDEHGADDQKPVAPPQKLVFGSARVFEVVVAGTGSDVAVYMLEDVVDFQMCIYDRLYRSVARLCNRAPTALKCNVVVPAALRGFVEFTPNVGYIQKQSTMDIQVKFTPNQRLADQLGEFVDVPVTVNVPDQVLPVTFSIRAQLSASRLIITQPALLTAPQSPVPAATIPSSPSALIPSARASARDGLESTLAPSAARHLRLEFGRVLINQSAAIAVTFTNPAPVLQKLVFTNLRQEMSVWPNDGMLTILPHRSLTAHVILSPRAATELNFDVVVRSKLAHNYTLTCHAIAVVPPLSLSASVIHFPATSDGDTEHTFFMATNTTAVPQQFEFVIPPPPPVRANTGSANSPYALSTESFLTLTPHLVTLQPKQSTRIQVWFRPEVRKRAKAAAAAAEKATAIATAALAAAEAANNSNATGDDATPAAATAGKPALASIMGSPAPSTGLKDEKHTASASAKANSPAASPAPGATAAPRAATKPGAAAAGGKQLSKKAKAEEAAAAAREAELAAERARVEQAARDDAERASKELASYEQMIRNERAEERHRLRTQCSSVDTDSLGAPSVVVFTDLPPAPDADGSISAADLAAEEDWSRHARFRIACFVRPAPSPAGSAASALAATTADSKAVVPAAASGTSAGASSGDSDMHVMYLDIHTTVVLPVLIPTVAELDFGQVIVGKSVIKSFEIRNHGGPPCELRLSQPLGVASAFHVLNALRRLDTDSAQTVVIEFRPNVENRVVQQSLVLCGVVPGAASSGSDIPMVAAAKTSVVLRGHCVRPELEITPLAPGGVLDAGDVMVGVTVKRTIRIKNLSTFALSFTVDTVPERDDAADLMADGGGGGDQSDSDSDGGGDRRRVRHRRGGKSSRRPAPAERNMKGLSEFYFVPGEATIKAGETLEMACYFAPDHPSPNYRTTINIANETLRVVGRCWSRQMYITGGDNDTTPSAMYSRGAVAFLDRHSVLQSVFPPATWQVANFGAAAGSQKDSKDAKLAARQAAKQEAAAAAAGADGTTATASASSGGGAASMLAAASALGLLGRQPAAGMTIGVDHSMSHLFALSSDSGSNEKLRLLFQLRGGTSADAKRRRQRAGGLTISEIDESVPATDAAAAAPTSARAAKRAAAAAASAAASATAADTKSDAKATAKPDKASAAAAAAAAASAAATANLPYRELWIGSCDANDTKSVGSFEFTFEAPSAAAAGDGATVAVGGSKKSAAAAAAAGGGSANFFRIEPMSGTIPAGTTRKIVFTFDVPRFEAARTDKTETVGEWVECAAKVTLKGGVVPFAGAAQQTYDLSLRIYID